MLPYIAYMDPMGVNGCNCCRGHFFSGRPRSWWQKGVVLPAAPASFLCWIQEDLQWWSLLVSGLRFISNTSFFGVKKLSGPPNKKMTWLDSMMIMRCDSMFKQWWNLKGKSNLNQKDLPVPLKAQEDLRAQLRKMEAGASDHETVAVSWLCWDE